MQSQEKNFLCFEEAAEKCNKGSKHQTSQSHPQTWLQRAEADRFRRGPHTQSLQAILVWRGPESKAAGETFLLIH